MSWVLGLLELSTRLRGRPALGARRAARRAVTRERTQVRQGRRAASRRRARGMAFILVLGALTILTVMLAEVQDESSAEFSSALSARDAVVAEYAARSAVNLSRLLISTEPTVRMALGPILAMAYRGASPQIPVWNFTDQMLGAFNDNAGKETFAAFSGLDLERGKNLGFPGASFELKIIDEDSKINVNAANRQLIARVRLMQQLMSLMSGPQFDPLFERRGADGDFSDRQTICAAIIDWVDPDTETMLCDPVGSTQNQDMPAEDAYYQQLDRPYFRRNAPFDSLEELRMVRGMSDDFWATFVDPDPDRPDKRLLTVWGTSGSVNVNTAAPQALLALVCASAVPDTPLCKDPLEMQKFLMVMTLARSFTMGAPPFSSPKMFINTLSGQGLLGPVLAAAGLQPVQIQSPDTFEQMLSTESKVFSVYATGVVRAGKRETRVSIHQVVDFRDAPAPGVDELTAGQGQQQQPLQPQQPTQPTNPNQPDLAFARVLAADPGGNVVYFRVY